MQFASSIEGGIVSPEIAIQMHQLGKDAWNNWMETDFANLTSIPTLLLDARFDGDISFDGFVFKCNIKLGGGHSSFQGAEFHEKFTLNGTWGTLNFEKAVFHKAFSITENLSEGVTKFNLILDSATFHQGFKLESIIFIGSIKARKMICSGEFRLYDIHFKTPNEFESVTLDFTGSIFNSSVYAFACKFVQVVSFQKCQFNGDKVEFLSCTSNPSIVFEGSSFCAVPIFSQTNLTPESVANIQVEYTYSVTKHWKIFNKASRLEAAQAYRQLKQMAVARQDHAAEQRYFAQEMRAKRWHEETHIANLSINYVYEMVSNYGQSILRPFILLWTVVFLNTILYLQTSPINNWTLAFYYSLSNSLPFGSLTRRSQSLYSQLYPKGIEAYPEQLTLFYTTIGLNGFFGFVFLFLIGLGLRNQFRL